MMEDFWNNDNFFKPSFFNNHELLPAVNIRDTAKGYELEVAAPGFKKEDFKITTENGLLTISAETSIPDGNLPALPSAGLSICLITFRKKRLRQRIRMVYLP